MMSYNSFTEYIKTVEPSKREKAYAWRTAIGLQAVDGLEPSEYLIELAVQNIEGKISIYETNDLLHSYYEEKQPNQPRLYAVDFV